MPEIREIRTKEISRSLELLMYDRNIDRADLDERIANFRRLARREKYNLRRQVVASDGSDIFYSCFYVPGSGGTAFVFTSNPQRLNDAQKQNAVEALRQMRRQAVNEGCNLLQIIFETDDEQRAEICQAGGFTEMTDFIYMFRQVSEPLAPFETSANMTWQSYNEQNAELFKEVINRTYINSVDCCELEELRTMDEVMESHKGAGDFDPAWWEILSVDNDPVGVIMMTPLTNGDTIELTYTGVAPAYRGLGYSHVLLNRALAAVSRTMYKTVTLALDVRNNFAHKAYNKFGFQELFRRKVFYYSSRRANG